MVDRAARDTSEFVGEIILVAKKVLGEEDRGRDVARVREAKQIPADRNATLLGDACHPMTPYMAQGAAMAIEDAAVLSRCLEGVEREGIANAFRRFEASRKDRTARVQQTSRTNTWLKEKTDTDWVYAYDAWTAPLAA